MLTAADITGDAAFVVLSAGAPQKCIATSTFLKLKAATEPYGGKDIALRTVHHGN